MSQAQATKRVRLAQRRKRIRRLKLLILLAATILVFAALMFTLTQEWATISTVQTTGNSTVSAAAIESLVFDQMATLRAYTLYAGTVLTYDKAGIIEALQYKYPQLKQVKLGSKSLYTLDVSVVEREPAASWCSDLGECYFVDSGGYIYRKVNDSEQAKGLVQYKGGGITSPLRSTLLPGRFSTVQEFVQVLTRDGLEVQAVELYTDTDELLVYSLGHATLRVKLSADLERTASYVEAVLSSSDYKEYIDTNTEPEYIDMRFGNRVYYK